MPWLWEVWSSEPPYFWALLTKDDIRKNKQTEDAPQGSDIIATTTINIKQLQAEWSMPRPPLHGTNWFSLYRNIKQHWWELRGLQNRKRIWEYQEKMFVQLKRYIKTSLIDSPTLGV